MNNSWHIQTLNDLFYALFRQGTGDAPVIQGHPRLVREDYFSLFFPDALCEQYLGKAKANLTWFFNSDRKNKAIKRSLIALAKADGRRVTDAMVQKCREVLWPQGRHAAFDAVALGTVLRSVRLPGALNSRYRIVPAAGGDGGECRLDACLRADAADALARMMLTLAVVPDAPEAIIAMIWLPDGGGFAPAEAGNALQAQLAAARRLDAEGQRERAYEAYVQAARRMGDPAASPEEAELFCRLGEMLAAGEGHYRDAEAALAWFRRGAVDSCPRAFFLLARHSAGGEALAHMEKAAALGYPPAIRELGNAWFSGSEQLGCAADPEAAARCFRMGLGLPGETGAYCAYMLGRIHELNGDADAGARLYRIAREGGSLEASERLAQLDWTLAGTGAAAAGEDSQEEGPLRYCVMNGFTGSNRAFHRTLPGRWSTTVCGAEPLPRLPGLRDCQGDCAQALRQLAEEAFPREGEDFPELVLALLSEDWGDNLSQAVALLGELQRIAIELKDRAWALVEKVDIYVMAEHDYASAMLDAAFAGMRRLYFRVRVCDPAVDAADYLFASAPLFLPCLRARDCGHVRMNVVGCGATALAVLRRAISLPMPEGVRVSAHVYGEDAEHMERRFYACCPGVRSAPPTIQRLVPGFHSCSPEEDLAELLRRARAARVGGQAGDARPEEGEQQLALGNYCVIATDDDALNIRLGMLLRRELLRLSVGGDDMPFIAVYVRDSVTGRLAEGLAANPGASSAGRYARYDLFAFGPAVTCTYARLRDDLTERRARQMHLLYAGLPREREARHAAMSSYYKKQYNRDSSRATAQSLIYRLFQAGLALPSWQLYGTAAEEARLGPAYTRWLEQPGNLEAAARAEHERWNCMMLSMGWEQATPLQTAGYVQQGNRGHQCTLGRLHPFICDWQALKSGRLLREIREIVQAQFPELKVYDPIRFDEEAVRDTERLLAVTDEREAP